MQRSRNFQNDPAAANRNGKRRMGVEAASSLQQARRGSMNSVIYIVGLVVVVGAVLAFVF
jgi:cobalamin biosynthesis Mg chelatase CobN